MGARDTRDSAVSLPESQAEPTPVSWVEAAPDVCGGEARVRRTRITVWGLVEWRKLGLSDSEIMERVPDLTQADLDAAWGYYERHGEEIDQAIRENSEA
jgi:uncharacterized protein (DUF433 family)